MTTLSYNFTPVLGKRASPTQQAASIQQAMRGVARDLALAMPARIIAYGVELNGVRTDPVTYVMYALANRFEALEDERTMTSGTSVLDFRARPGERIDSVLTRFDLARHEPKVLVRASITFTSLRLYS